MRIVELKLLAEVVRATNPRFFNMGRWFKRNRAGCGTQACAIGTGIIFNVVPEGLVLDASDNPVWKPTGETGFAATAKAYHISKEDASYLFGPDNYTRGSSPTTVANRILKFCREHRHGY